MAIWFVVYHNLYDISHLVARNCFSISVIGRYFQASACISISLKLCIFSKISEYIMMMDAYPLGSKDFILCIINLSIECTNVCRHYLLNLIAMWNAIQKNGYSFGANLELTCGILHWNEFMFNFCHVTCQMWSVNVDGKKIQMFAWIVFWCCWYTSHSDMKIYHSLVIIPLRSISISLQPKECV